jgi:hypothetical protein
MADQTPAPVTAGAIPWYRSPTIISSISTIVSMLVVLAPKLTDAVGLTASNVPVFVNTTFEIIAAISGVIAGISRARSTVQPLVSGPAAAAVHPSTIAVIQTQAAMRAAGIPTAVEKEQMNTGVKPK